jgi:hypothetical protein
MRPKQKDCKFKASLNYIARLPKEREKKKKKKDSKEKKKIGKYRILE